MNALTEYAEQMKETDTPIIGMVAWYSVSDSVLVDCYEMAEVIEKWGAPMKPPAVPKNGDVFRRACNEAQRKKIPTAVLGEFINYNLQDLSHDDAFVYRMIVAETVDSREKRLGYQVLAKAIFDRATSKVEFVPVEDERTGEFSDLLDDPTYAAICQDITQYIQSRMTIVSPIQIRASIKDAFEKSLNGISARPGGGVYFVGNDHLEGLAAIDAVANSFDGVSVHPIPLPDTERQRQMVKQAFEDESLRATQRLLVDLKELNAQDKPSGKRFTDLKVQYDEHTAKMKEYKKILGDNIGEAELTLKIAEAMLVSITQKV